MAEFNSIHYIDKLNIRFIGVWKWPIPVVARSKAWVYGRSLAGIVGSNPAGGMDVCLCCVISGKGLCDGLITRPEKSYQL